jgi:predicted metal-binding membrane protein
MPAKVRSLVLGDFARLFDVPRLLRKLRGEGRWSLVMVALMAPLSLLAMWLWSTTPDAPPMSHGARPPGIGVLGWLAVFLMAWMLMSAAMMLPSAMSLLVALDRVSRKERTRHQIPFAAAGAYLGVWGVVGGTAWLASFGFESFINDGMSGGTKAKLAGAGLILAGMYGLSPLATACLRACRRPFGFLVRYWNGRRDYRLQAAIIGGAYGISCVGCCVPMIAIMLVLGMSHLAVTIALGVVMVFMKSGAGGTGLARILSVLLIGAGVAIAMTWIPFSPHHLHH